MAIQIICPGCKTRFKVSDQFAGRTGPCPKCKTVIKIPTKAEAVVIHGDAPQTVDGTKGGAPAGPRAIPQPIFREDKGLSPVAISLGVGSFVAILFGAAIVRATMYPAMALDPQTGREYFPGYPEWLMGVGAFLVAIPVSYYGFRALESGDIERISTGEALKRSGIAALLYTALWGIVYLFKQFVFTEELELYELILVPVVIAVGGVIGMAGFDLDYLKGLVHAAFYIGLCVLLRLILGLGPF